MLSTKKGIVLVLPFLAVLASLAFAEPSYLIYPSSPAVFRYDADRYEIVTPGNPNFDDAFAVGNLMLWDRIEGRVPVEIYRAPSITSFEASSNGRNEFVTIGNDFEVIVDGFGATRRTIGGLHVRFWPEPSYSFLQLTVDGKLISGLTMALPALEVGTDAGDGFYADTSRFMLNWIGASGLRVVAFSDKDADRTLDGTPLFSIVARDETVPVATTTWGQIKALYRD
jgi:hypothetical protein